MIKIVLVLLYLYGGEVRLEQHPYASEEQCVAAANVRVEQLVKDPKFDTGLFGACLPLQVVEAKK